MELLLEVRDQRSEIYSLKEEVRGASQTVDSEVKRIKKMLMTFAGILKDKGCSLSSIAKLRIV